MSVEAGTNLQLHASPNAEKNYVELNWNNPYGNGTSYRLYRQDTNGEWRSIPAKASVKVLNIYPDYNRVNQPIPNRGLSGGQVDLEGKPVLDSGILKTWLLKENKKDGE